MARKKRSPTAWNRAFGACARSTFPAATSQKDYGRLMSQCLAEKGGKAKGRKKK